MLKKVVLLMVIVVLFLFSLNNFCKNNFNFLIQIEKQGSNEKDLFLEKDFKIVYETLKSLIIVGDKDDILKIEKYGYNYQIIDSSPNEFKYFSIGLREDSNLEIVKSSGEIVYSEDNIVILRIPKTFELENLYDAKVFIAPISLDGMKKPLYEDEVSKKNLARQEYTDPIVQKILNTVSTTNIDNTWNTVTSNPPTGTRYSTNQGCFDASNYVLNQFQSWGLQTRSLTHTSGYAPNIEGEITGQVKPSEIYLIEGHLDDMPSSGTAPGADDNGSGSVTVIEAARALSCYGFKKTVRFLTVTGEEQGLYGSTDYANDSFSLGENIQGVLNFDMPGWQGDGIPNPENLDLNYDSNSQSLGEFFAQTAVNYSTGLNVDAFLCPSLNASDHYQFWVNGYKAVCGITDNEGYCGHSGSYSYYHTVNDTIANCGNRNFFYSVVKTAVAALAELGEPFRITFDKTSYGCSSTVQIIVADKDLNTNPSLQENVIVPVWSNIESTPENVTLSEEGTNSMIFKGTITLTTNPPSNGDGFLSVGNGSTIYSRYIDAVDCDGSTNFEYNASASACTPPVISNVTVTDLTATTAKITWDTNIPANSRVTYGSSIPPTTNVDDLSNYVTAHSITISGLTPCSTYYFSVTSTDEGGNSSTDNNGGEYYVFTTLGALYAYGPFDVESGTTGWTMTNQWHQDNCKAHSGSYAFKVGSTTCPGTYNASTTSYLTTSSPINLGSAGHGYHLKFWEYYQTESGYDFCRPQISTNGTTFTTLGTQYAGSGTTWAQRDYDLSAYSGNVWIRFEFYADSLYNYEGWYIDDIEISKNAPCTPEIVYFSNSFTDTCNGSGNGNNDGIIDPGEDISLTLTLKNNGLQNATGVNATITTETSGVVITDNSASFPNISANGGTGTSLDTFGFRVGSEVSCGTTINFTIHSVSNENPTGTDSNFSLIVGSLIGGASTDLFTESFDNSTFPPPGWSQVDVSGTTGNWARATATVHPSGGTPHSGAGLAYFNSYTATSGNSTRLYRTIATSLPSEAQSAAVVFWMIHDTGYSSNNDRIQVQISLNGSTWSNVGSAISRYDGSTGWKEHTIDLTSYIGQSIYLGFLGISDYGNDCHIDDVKVTYTMPPSCTINPCTSSGTPPGEVATGTNYTWSGQVMNWNGDPNATGYRVYRGVKGNLANLCDANTDFCTRYDGANTNLDVTSDDPAVIDPTNRVLYYLITGYNGGGEGPAGNANCGERVVNSTGGC